MGFHICEYCVESNLPPQTSSGDVYLDFANGNSYVVPDMIIHYIVDHNYCPPPGFVYDVMNERMAGGRRRQTKGMPVQIGYLNGEFKKVDVPTGFVYRLVQLIRQAETEGNRLQTRGL